MQKKKGERVNQRNPGGCNDCFFIIRNDSFYIFLYCLLVFSFIFIFFFFNFHFVFRIFLLLFFFTVLFSLALKKKSVRIDNSYYLHQYIYTYLIIFYCVQSTISMCKRDVLGAWVAFYVGSVFILTACIRRWVPGINHMANLKGKRRAVFYIGNAHRISFL